MKLLATTIFATLCVACTADPVYIEADTLVQIDGSDAEVAGTGQLLLPIRLEEDDEAEDREALAGELGVEVPFVLLDDVFVSVEWSITNESDSDARAELHINGSNDRFTYVPLNFVVDPEEEPVPPSLLQTPPLTVPAGETVFGVFREDDVREASLDLELITRGGLNPFAAMLEVHEDLTEIEVEGGTPIPIDALASLVQLDVALFGNQPLLLRYAVRVRSRRRPNYVHEEGLSAPEEELTVFSPVEFVPPPPPDE